MPRGGLHTGWKFCTVAALYRAGGADDASAKPFPQAQRLQFTVERGFLHRFLANKEDLTMRGHTRTALLVLLGSAAFAFGAGTASAQGSLQKFVINDDAAKKAMTHEEISGYRGEDHQGLPGFCGAE